MAENKMKEVAKLLGVELEEEFRIEGLTRKHKLTENGLRCWFDDFQQWYASYYIDELLAGEAKIIKLPKPILDEKEKEYLSAVIKPFKDRVIYIKKCEDEQDEYIGIQLKYYANKMVRDTLILPSFKKGTMYSKMETEKEYTLEELGL